MEENHQNTLNFERPPPEIHKRLILQSDFDEALKEPEGKSWVSFKSPGNPTVYGELKSNGLSGEGIPYVTGSAGFDVNKVTEKSIEIAYRVNETHIERKFLAPHKNFKNVHTKGKSIHCLDVSAGGLGVSSDSEGKLKIWETKNGEVRRLLEGHLGDVYTCRLFPSGIVVLSGGSDMMLKIWSAETGQCVATLTGHKASILDTSIIDRGRNIISCSKDGTSKLWDCGTQTCLSTYQCEAGIVNCCDIAAMWERFHLGQPDEPNSEREVGTTGKILILGCDNKTVKAFGIHSKKKIWDITDCIFDAVTCCKFISPVMFICGQQDGHMTCFDIRNPSKCVKSWCESRGPVLSLLNCKPGYISSHGDGSCHYMEHLFDTTVELTGPDCDPVYSVVDDGKYLYTACRDSIIRKYDMSDVLSIIEVFGF
ncbi:Proteasomal ATPase-associated factor 1 [Mactra antiquata]